MLYGERIYKLYVYERSNLKKKKGKKNFLDFLDYTIKIRSNDKFDR